MANSNPQIVGGGVAAGSTFGLGQIPYVTNVNPPELMTYGPSVVTDSVSAVVYTSVPNSAGVHNTITNATETLRVQGGAIIAGAGATSTQIGNGASAGTTDSIAIGRGATVTTATQAVVIGATASNGGNTGVVIGFAAGFTNASGVAIGVSAAVTGNAGGATGVAIGPLASVANTSGGGGSGVAIGASAVAVAEDVVIGGGASSNQNNAAGVGNVVIGRQATANISGGSVFAVVIGWTAVSTQKLATVIGSAATATAASGQTRAIVIGSGSTTSATDAIVIGGGSTITTVSIALGAGAVDLGAGFLQLGAAGTPITTVVIGAGGTIAAPVAKTIRFTNATGADNAAASVTIIAPRSTGNAAAGTIIFQVGAVGASSSTLQTATTQLTIGDGIVTIAGLISAAGLPTSAGAAGTLWVDAGASNVVKRA